jgi:hypothetical protein
MAGQSLAQKIMLKKLLGAVDSARKAFSSDVSLIKQGLGGLDLVDKALTARAVDFVANGNQANVLIDLRAHGTRASVLLGQPGRLKWAFYSNKDDPDKVAGALTLAGRNCLYQRIDPAAPDITMLVRLAKVLEAADHGTQVDHTGASMPEWLQYLLNDALWASFQTKGFVREHDDRTAWDIKLLAAILEHEELPSAMALPIVFERRGLDSYYHDQTYVRLLASGALDEYMLANAPAVEAAAATLSAVGRVVLANRIGSNPALLAAFTTLMVKLAVSDSKTLRAAAARHLDGIERTSCVAVLGDLLRNGQSDERANSADLLARTQGADAVHVLEAALANEAGKSVQQSIRIALSRLQAAGDAGVMALPEPPALPPPPIQVLGDDTLALLLANRAELLERLRKGAADETEANLTAQYKYNYRRDHFERYKLLSEKELRSAFLGLNGKGNKDDQAALNNRNVLETLSFAGRLEARRDFGLLQALRWIVHSGQSGWTIWFHPIFQTWLRKQDKTVIDLRQLEALVVQCGGQDDAIAISCLKQFWGKVETPQAALPPQRVWPYFAANPAIIDEGLGLSAAKDRGRYGEISLANTLAVLATFPTIPARWLPRVMEFALGEGKTHRAAAQQVLSKQPDIGKQVCEALASSKLELRIEAARWLADLNYRSAVPVLYTAFEKETRETASAAMMTALEKLGEDLAPYLAPEKLLAQARKGLKGKPPSGMAWLNLDALPVCHWRDGSGVEPDLIRWWVILSCKLKEPAGNALLERYMGLINPQGRAALGAFLLHQFIARDISHPSLEEGIAWASAHAAQRYQQYQTWAKQHPQYYEAHGKLTQEQVFEELKCEKMAEYLGTAINEKGILALVSGMPGHELVSAMQVYMRDHYQRRAQVEAMLEAACLSNEPSVIQFTLGIARRYRTASVQEKARVLVQRIAERNGWTQDQLADRTIPTGGLDEHGRLTLQYGSREFTVMLDAAMKPILQNSEGKTVSALPAPRQGDPADAIKEAKQQFATCKTELKQVIEMQTARLYEAMCAGRTWPLAEWREYLQQHPIVGRLGQRLVWMTLTPEVQPSQLFRPADDGSLLNTEDDEVDLADDATICLAHAALLPDEDVAAWVAHFKDYKLAPLFAQMTRKRPALPEKIGAETITDREGWISDAFTLRGTFNKLGYQRGQGEDGGFFHEYRKDFASAQIGVSIEFSGNGLPEENVPAALKTLGFYSLDGQRQTTLALDKVPTVLLAEAYGDYHAVAAACVGFDPEWEKKMPW